MDVQSAQQYIGLVAKLQQKYGPPYQEQDCFGSPCDKPTLSEFIFRGHSDHSYELVPGIFRTQSLSDGLRKPKYHQEEYSALYDFISYSCAYERGIHSTDIVPWLEIAQHYGVATRLLDFTTNPLVALYFACCDRLKSQQDASVWIVNASAYRRALFSLTDREATVPAIIDSMVRARVSKGLLGFLPDELRIFEGHIAVPWIYRPFYRYDRMNSQSSVFMIWGEDKRDLTCQVNREHWMTDDDSVRNQESGLICQVTIPSECKAHIMQQLDMLGVNERFIYPGLDGIGRYIHDRQES